MMSAALLAASFVTSATDASLVKPKAFRVTVQFKKRTGSRVSGTLSVCSDRTGVRTSGKLAGLAPNAPYRIVVATTRKSAKAGRGRALRSFKPNATGSAQLGLVNAGLHPLKPAQNWYGLVSDSDAVDVQEESVETGPEEALSGSDCGDPGSPPPQPPPSPPAPPPPPPPPPK